MLWLNALGAVFGVKKCAVRYLDCLWERGMVPGGYNLGIREPMTVAEVLARIQIGHGKTFHRISWAWLAEHVAMAPGMPAHESLKVLLASSAVACLGADPSRVSFAALVMALRATGVAYGVGCLWGGWKRLAGSRAAVLASEVPPPGFGDSSVVARQWHVEPIKWYTAYMHSLRALMPQGSVVVPDNVVVLQSSGDDLPS